MTLTAPASYCEPGLTEDGLYCNIRATHDMGEASFFPHTELQKLTGQKSSLKNFYFMLRRGQYNTRDV